MNLTRDTDSLTHFKRNTTKIIEQLKVTGASMILTVNGKAEIVVQDAAWYQRLLEIVERAEAIVGIKKGLDYMARGEGILAETAFERLRAKHNIPRSA